MFVRVGFGDEIIERASTITGLRGSAAYAAAWSCVAVFLISIVLYAATVEPG